MTEKKVTINIYRANAFSLVLAAAVGVVSIALWLTVCNGSLHSQPAALLYRSIIFPIALLIGIVAHELIHGLTWACFSKGGWKSISFGIIWKMLTPYCHCDQPLPLRAYLIGCLMPLIVLGLVPWIVGLCFGMGLLIIWGVIFIACAAGDILIAWKLRHEPPTATILDHPTEAGCTVYQQD